jgi:hypothetical protein
MRTAFGEIRLFNDHDFGTRHLLCETGKSGEQDKQWRDRERERGRETERCSERVLAWAINRTVEQIFMMG